jgi:hypothetical protein
MARRGRAVKRRRRRSRYGTLWQILVPVSLLVVVVALAFVILRPAAPTQLALPSRPPPCPDVPDVVVGNISVPAGPVAGYCQAQLINAAQVMRAADAYTDNLRAKQIGVMTAIGESDLRNLDYGDTAGPDSRGIFQQRSNWGPLADRMDPYTAAFNFYHRMFNVFNWADVPPTQLAHRVQGNADPNYYAKYFSRATKVVNGLLADQVPPPPSAAPIPTPTG